jgi:hypothetical protein
MIFLMTMIMLILFILVAAAVPIAVLPSNLTECEQSPLKGNPDITEYKCSVNATSYVPK